MSKTAKEKTISIRVTDNTYSFITAKAKEKGLTKASYIMHQLDENSELVAHLNKEIEQMDKDLEEINRQMMEMKEETINWFASLPYTTLQELYKTETSPKMKRQMKEAAKRSNYLLHD